MVGGRLGVLLFCLGTNWLRFRYPLNMQDMVGSLYAAKFDLPFEEDPWASAAAELLRDIVFGWRQLQSFRLVSSGYFSRSVVDGSLAGVLFSDL